MKNRILFTSRHRTTGEITEAFSILKNGQECFSITSLALLDKEVAHLDTPGDWTMSMSACWWLDQLISSLLSVVPLLNQINFPCQLQVDALHCVLFLFSRHVFQHWFSSLHIMHQLLDFVASGNLGKFPDWGNRKGKQHFDPMPRLEKPAYISLRWRQYYCGTNRLTQTDFAWWQDSFCTWHKGGTRNRHAIVPVFFNSLWLKVLSNEVAFWVSQG